ncbi:MAG: hypothetical protein AAGA67_03530 [Cyanobacteria bacterium P01_F01_bin.153]
MLSDPGLFLAIGLALVHGFLSKLNLFKFLPEHRWISFAGGVSIGYVFIEVFPELGKAQLELEHSKLPVVAYLESHVYLLALLGLLVFYGLDILALASRRRNRVANSVESPSKAVFWIHIAGFAILNVIVGYLMQEMGSHNWWECVLFFIAISLHFFIIDRHLRHHHQNTYDKVGRWILTGAILAGAIIGRSLHLDEAAIAIIWSFMAGSIILNILGHELPDEHKSCFGSFTVGAAIYSGLILAI